MSSSPPPHADPNVTWTEQLSARIHAYIQAHQASGERYSQAQLARLIGIAQQTLNDLLRGKVNSITRLTHIKIIEFLEQNPAPPPTAPLARADTGGLGPATALMMLRRDS